MNQQTMIDARRHGVEKPGFYVVCDEFWSGPHKTAAGAERAMQRIEDFGACLETHRIKEVR